MLGLPTITEQDEAGEIDQTRGVDVAVGPDAGLLEGSEPLQSYMKHKLLKRYVLVFTHKLTRGTGLGVTLVDGYAGRPGYEDGTPGSSDLLIDTALSAETANVELVEKKPEFVHEQRDALARRAEEYPGILDRIAVYEGNVEQHLSELLRRNQSRHLFLFLDPCGAGLSFEQVVQLLTSLGGSFGAKTEILLNFNASLVRRVVGYWMKRDTADGTADRSVLNAVCGGSWWIDAARRGRERDASTWEAALEEVVAEYVHRLSMAVKGSIIGSVPVRARVTNQPVFYLIFATSSPIGVWAFNNAVAFATREWRDECEKRDPVLQPSLVDVVQAEEDEQRARQRLRENVVKLLEQYHTLSPIRDYSPWLIDGLGGALKESEIGQELRVMAQEGLISLEKKKKVELYSVSRLR